MQCESEDKRLGERHDFPPAIRHGAREESPSQQSMPQLREYIIFGKDHGTEPLKWIILGIADGKTLLLSDRILDVHKYDDGYDEECAWEDSDIEEWIADELIYDLFSSTERVYMDSAPRIPTTLEIERCFPRDEDRIAYPTAYARVQGLECNAFGAGGYWTSTPGERPCHIAYVRPDGDINTKGFPQDDEAGLGVRLTITLNVDVHEGSQLYPPCAGDTFIDDQGDAGDSSPLKDSSCGDTHGSSSLSQKQIALLRILADSEGMRAFELVQCTDIPASSVHMALSVLEKHGLVEKEVDGRWRVSPNSEALLDDRPHETRMQEGRC